MHSCEWVVRSSAAIFFSGNSRFGRTRMAPKKRQDTGSRAAWIPASFWFCCVRGWMCPTATRAQSAAFADGTAAMKNPPAIELGATCRIIYLGFVGGLESANNKNSGVVNIRDTLEGEEFPDVCAKSYSPYVWMEGRDWLLKHFPSHAGALTPAELERSPRVVMVGHSLGGWAMMAVARALCKRDIPVELTIHVDSVGITDSTLPRNVKAAAIFHARDVLMFLTTKRLRREDPKRTELLANVTVAGAGHESITRDPRIRDLVYAAVKSLRTAHAVEPLSSVP